MSRIKEPSTWAGIAAIFQALAFAFPLHAVAMNVVTAAAGAAAVALREGRGGLDGSNN